jgi:hypothetical protein
MDEDVQQMTAAHKAMVMYPNTISGKTRHAIVEAMVTAFSGTEAAAEKASTDVKSQAAKVFWDKIKTDAIAVIQHFSLAPTGEGGTALATMKEFQDWFRDHKTPNKEPWKEKKTG